MGPPEIAIFRVGSGGSGAVRVGKIIFPVGEIVVLGDNLGAKTASVCPSTETNITCSHVLVGEILGTWRARSPQKTAASWGPYAGPEGCPGGENDFSSG